MSPYFLFHKVGNPVLNIYCHPCANNMSYLHSGVLVADSIVILGAISIQQCFCFVVFMMKFQWLSCFSYAVVIFEQTHLCQLTI
jgi:hypothetical protein